MGYMWILLLFRRLVDLTASFTQIRWRRTALRGQGSGKTVATAAGWLHIAASVRASCFEQSFCRLEHILCRGRLSLGGSAMFDMSNQVVHPSMVHENNEHEDRNEE